ncbi:MAG: SDR family oxidoreductase [Bacteroidales bacterium]|jgi:UDP-N-acetylglucosamine 4-epimerase|nr:SDR family oxidoreductase [Bacteroidales bacterium]MDD4175800.1 SDR family oxidoreductase [Bacteroidales bacterium]MDY0333424.1 SDR family oxidoreductase [Bacteroidales bacterium]
MTLSGKKLLITGGAGFIGSNLIERFITQNNTIVCLDNLATGKLNNIRPFFDRSDFTFIEGDIRDYDTCRKAVEGVDVVLHQAAMGSVPRSIADPVTTNDVNIGGFVNMLTATKEAGVKRFVYAASSSTYGDHPALPKKEDQIGRPLSPYAVTKYVNELYANVFSDLYGIETIGLRYFNVFGRRQDPNGAYAAAIPKFIKLLITYQSPHIYGDGLQSRDFTYIDNVIQANELAATVVQRRALNTVYNIAFGDATTVVELIETLKEYLSEFDPRIASVDPVKGEKRVGDILHSLASIDRARDLLSYQPEYDLRKGLKEAIRWYWENLQ